MASNGPLYELDTTGYKTWVNSVSVAMLILAMWL